MKSFKATIADRRGKLLMSQQQVADRMGIHRARLAMWETGRAYPRVVALITLGRALEMNPHKLLDAIEAENR